MRRPSVQVLALYDKDGSNAHGLLHKSILSLRQRLLIQAIHFGLLRNNDKKRCHLAPVYSLDNGAASTLVQPNGTIHTGHSLNMVCWRRAFCCGTEARVMSVILRAEILSREVARRGWNLADLAHAAGVSSATVTAARAGRPVSPKSLRSIAAALASAPPLDGVDELLLG